MKPSYREFVVSQANRNPCLGGLASFLSTVPHTPSDTVSVCCLDFPLGDGAGGTERQMKLGECLLDVSSAIMRPSEMCIRRILLIEDIKPSMVEQLGVSLDISPLFFATYISTSFTGIDKAPPCPPVALFPTTFTSNDALHLHYQRAVNFPVAKGDYSTPYEFKTSGCVPRSIRRLPTLSSTQPGLIRSCCSILLKHLNDESWICKCCMWTTPYSCVTVTLHFPLQAWSL
jgi:hypothetical protein